MSLFSRRTGSDRESPRPRGKRPETGSRAGRVGLLEVERLEDRTVLSAQLLLSGTQNLVPNVNVDAHLSADSTTGYQNTAESEMMVDIDPTNPLRVAGLTHDMKNGGQMQLYYSADGGNTWAREIFAGVDGPGMVNDTFGPGSRFDPVLTFDALGNLFVAYCIQNDSNTKVVVAAAHHDDSITALPIDQWDWHFFKVAQQKNRDGGIGLDEPMMATGPSGPNATDPPAVYVTYTKLDTSWGSTVQEIWVSGLRDGQDTSFSAPVRVDDGWSPLEGGDRLPHYASPAVGPNGELYIAWETEEQYHNIVLDRDLDGLWGGRYGFGDDITVRHLDRYMHDAKPPAQYNRGIDNGAELTVDRSGGLHNGRLYLTFVDGFGSPTPAEDTDVYLVSSDDQGKDWTSFAPGDPGNVEGGPSTDFLPWVAVDQNTGSVSVAYYTTDGTPDNSQVNLRLASSIDGGATFSKVNVSSAPSRAESAKNGGMDFLEYIGLAVLDGTAQTFWADNRVSTPGGGFRSGPPLLLGQRGHTEHGQQARRQGYFRER